MDKDNSNTGSAKRGHLRGSYETLKFSERRIAYEDYKLFLEESDHSKGEIIENIGAFIGDLALNRVLTIYQYFRMTENIAGHIADVGTYKGASALLFSKLLKIYHPESIWQVHGFDWFKGMAPSENDSGNVINGGYKSSEEQLLDLVNRQKLNSIFHLHNFNLATETNSFFDSHQHLQFKLVFMDAGIYDVMVSCIPSFWDRLSPGGIMVFDQLSHELSPGEIRAVRECLPNKIINTLPNSWMPNAYIVK